MEQETTLLASFINRKRVGESLRLIKNNYNVYENKVYILNNKNNTKQLILTYNVIEDPDKKVQYRNVLKNTINIHRKRESNVLYTINALNIIIKLNNNNSENLDWNQYKNTLLLTQNDPNDSEIKNLYVINTSLNNIADLSKVKERTQEQ